MLKTVNCPTCGAPLDYSGNNGPIFCPYCKNSVVISENSQAPNQAPSSTSSRRSPSHADQAMARKLKRTQAELEQAQEQLQYIQQQTDKKNPNRTASNPYSGSNINLSRTQAILVGLGLIALSLLFPFIFMPIGIVNLFQNQIAVAIFCFIFAAAWFLGWGIPGVLYIFNKIRTISVSHRTY